MELGREESRLVDRGLVLASGAAVGAPKWTRLHLSRSSWDPQLVHVSTPDPQLTQVTVAKWEPEPALHALMRGK
jgi:hypothetical protein